MSDAGETILFEGGGLRLVGFSDGFRVESNDGFARKLDDEEAAYLRAVLTSLVAHVPEDEDLPPAYDEYLLQVCQAVQVKPDNPWELVFRSKPADEVGRMLAEI